MRVASSGVSTQSADPSAIKSNEAAGGKLAANQIHDLLSSGSPREQSQQIYEVLQDTPPGELNSVVHDLSATDISDIVNNLNPSLQKDLFNQFARNLDGTELKHVSDSLANYPYNYVNSLEQSVIEHAPPQGKLEYIKQFAGATSNKDQAAAGNVLASLKGTKYFGEAVNSLSTAQLCAVIKSSSPSSQNAIFSAAAASRLQNGQSDTTTKSKVFEAGAQALAPDVADGAINNVLPTLQSPFVSIPGWVSSKVFPTGPNPDPVGAANRQHIEQGLTNILNSDTTGVVNQLRQDQPSSGSALTAYMKEMLTEHPDGKSTSLLTQIGHLQGDRSNQTPTTFLQTKAKDANGVEGGYINAVNLGYFAGCLQAGLNASTSDKQAQANTLSNIFKAEAFVGGSAIGGPAGTAVGQAAGLTFQQIQDATSGLASGGKLSDALYKLCLPESFIKVTGPVYTDFNNELSTVAGNG